MNTKWIAAAGCVLAACDGPGSDIGPSFPKLPEASSKFVVLDDQGRGIVEAHLAVLGTSIAGTTARSGRGDLLADPRGRQRLRVDGSAAAAVAGDRLGTLVFAATLPGGDLPAVTFLPDVSASTGASLPVGTQAATTLIDDAATSGARLTIPAGSSIGMPSGVASVTVATGSLQTAHLPGDLPVALAGAVLFGRGLYVDPPEVTFTGPGATTLDGPDDLALPVGITATLWHLDEASGDWTVVATGIASSGGRLVQAVTAGGLYVFGAPVAAGSVTGRVRDAAVAPETPTMLRNVLISVDGRRTKTDPTGRFLVDGVAAVDASGAARTAAIEAFASGGWLPVRTTATAAMNGAAVIDVGDLTLDSVPAGNLRIQQIKRARAEPVRRCAVSSVEGAVAQATASDPNGRAVFEDVPSGWFGFQEGHPFDQFEVFYGQGIGFTDDERRWTDVRQFFTERGWYEEGRNSRVIVTEATGGGPIEGAALVQGSVDSSGFLGLTEEGGTIYAEREMSGRATATLRTVRGGRTILHAFTIDAPNGEHLEMPLQQALRASPGAFDRHGLVSGTLVGADPAKQHRLRVTRRLEVQEWWDDVAVGIPIQSALPIDLDPAVTHGPFRAGVAAAGGHLVASELGTTVPVTLEKAGIVSDLVPTEAAVVARDLPLDLLATTPFVVPNALVGLDPNLAAANLTFSLALLQPNGRAVDVVRGIGGNHTASGSDLTFLLPALAGPLAGHRWLLALGGSAALGSDTVSQQSLLQLAGGGAEAPIELLPVPTIIAPAAGSMVLASGFTVQFVLPPNSLFATIEMRSDVGGELHLWQVHVPGTATQFVFRRLPPEAQNPIEPGRTYSLTLTAYRSNPQGPLRASTGPYRDFTCYLQSIGVLERGVEAVSARTIQVTAN